MASRPILNYDILLEIAAVSSWKDSTGLLDSCRSLHLEGHKMLLRQPVSLYKESELLSFLAFLRRGLDGARHKSVRDLHFWLKRMSTKTSSKLVQALSQMSNLSALGMISSEYLFDGRGPGLLDAFAALTSLRMLYFPGAGEHTIRFLQKSQSQLVSVEIEFPPECDEDGFFDENVTPEEDWPKYHPAVLLAHSRPTLRELTCDRWYTHSEIMPDPELVYPEMCRLKMSTASIPLTAALVRAYPELAYLSILTCEADNSSASERPFHDATHRDKNLAAQGLPGCSWTKLEVFSGALVDLYLLGLACLVERVGLRALHRAHLYMLKPVLLHARPRHLLVRVLARGPDSAAEIYTALQGRGGSRLESLTLDYTLHRRDGGVDVAVLLEKLLSSLEHAPLQSLQLTIRLPTFTASEARRYDDSAAARVLRIMNGEDVDDDDEDELEEDEGDEGEDEEGEGEDANDSGIVIPSPRNPDSPPLYLAERSASEFDPGDYVRRFATLVPTLTRATVRIDGAWGHGSKRATLENGEVHVKG